MIYPKLSEVFGYNNKFMSGVSYEIWNEDSVMNDSGPIEKGWEIPMEIKSIENILQDVVSFGIQPNNNNILKDIWENFEPDINEMNDQKTHYLLHIKENDGSNLSKEKIHYINQLIDKLYI